MKAGAGSVRATHSKTTPPAREPGTEVVELPLRVPESRVRGVPRFFMFCKTVFPDIPDKAIAKMVAGEGRSVPADDELKRLARKAVDSGVADAFSADDVEATCEVLKGSSEGQAWIASFEESAEQWFNFSANRATITKIWIENLEVPFEFIRNYIDKVQSGEDLNVRRRHSC